MAKFQKGQSGNPAGKPKGARNRATLQVLELLDGETEQLTRTAIAVALGCPDDDGKRTKDPDVTALRLCLERLAPVKKDAPIQFDLPKLETADDAKMAMAAILDGVASGDITPMQATDLSKIVENFMRACEISELERRLAKLETGAGA